MSPAADNLKTQIYDITDIPAFNGSIPYELFMALTLIFFIFALLVFRRHVSKTRSQRFKNKSARSIASLVGTFLNDTGLDRDKLDRVSHQIRLFFSLCGFSEVETMTASEMKGYKWSDPDSAEYSKLLHDLSELEYLRHQKTISESVSRDVLENIQKSLNDLAERKIAERR